MTEVLAIEDTRTHCLLYKAALSRAGHHVRCSTSVREGLAEIRNRPFDVVLLDLCLPDGDGLQLMRQCLALRPASKVIVVTANGSVSDAVQAMRDGAFDFLLKPFDARHLVDAVENAVRGTSAQDWAAANPDERLYRLGALMGSSPEMEQVRSTVNSVARSMATVFITGEPGIGKRACARAIHVASSRVDGPFVALDCKNLAPDEVEAELFGRVEGAGPKAPANAGAIAAADGGTLYLDGICELDSGLQFKLLRFLESSTIRPMGSAHMERVNVRLICGTDRDPLQEMRAGRFRKDLFYHLYVIPIQLPPMRHRAEAIVETAEALLREIARGEGKCFTGLSEAAREAFRACSWPGNLRQLVNVIRNVVAQYDGPMVERVMLPHDMGGTEQVPPADRTGQEPGKSGDALAGFTLAEIERIAIEAAIGRNGGSVPQAARELDVAPSTIYRKRDAWDRGEIGPLPKASGRRNGG